MALSWSMPSQCSVSVLGAGLSSCTAGLGAAVLASAPTWQLSLLLLHLGQSEILPGLASSALAQRHCCPKASFCSFLIRKSEQRTKREGDTLVHGQLAAGLLPQSHPGQLGPHERQGSGIQSSSPMQVPGAKHLSHLLPSRMNTGRGGAQTQALQQGMLVSKGGTASTTSGHFYLRS